MFSINAHYYCQGVIVATGASLTHFELSFWYFDRLRYAVTNTNQLMYWLQVSSSGAKILAVMFGRWQNLLSVKTLEFSKPSKKALIVQTEGQYLMHRTYKGGVSYREISLSALANSVISFLHLFKSFNYLECICFGFLRLWNLSLTDFLMDTGTLCPHFIAVL